MANLDCECEQFSYKTRNVVRDRGAVVSAEFPDWVARVSKRVEENENVGPRIDQLTINNYRPGDGIPHRASLSAIPSQQSS